MARDSGTTSPPGSRGSSKWEQRSPSAAPLAVFLWAHPPSARLTESDPNWAPERARLASGASDLQPQGTEPACTSPRHPRDGGWAAAQGRKQALLKTAFEGEKL